MSQVDFIVYSDDESCAEALRKLIESSGRARVVACVTDEREIASTLTREKPYVLLADLGRAPHLVLDCLAEVDAPPGGMILCGPSQDGAVVLRALKLGVREFLSEAPNEAELAKVVDQISAARKQSSTTPDRAPVIAVIGGKGGVGATFVACQLAVDLQLAGERTAVVDLNLPMGDVALHFDLHPNYTLSDAVHSSDQIDEALVSGLLQKHASSGVEILAAPDRVEAAELIEERHVEAVMDQLRSRFSRVVVDVSRSWSPGSVCVVEMASVILIVTLQDVPSLSHARSQRDLLLRLGIPANRIRTIINRHASDAGVSDSDVARFLGGTPDFCLPNDYGTAIQSVNEGRAVADVAPGSAIDSAFHSLTRLSFEWLHLEPPISLMSRGNRGSWARNLIHKFAGRA